MTTNDTFERRLEAWLAEESAHRVPAHLDQVLVQTVATGQRPGWSSLERWLPMTTTTRDRLAVPQPILWFALLAALLVALVGVAIMAGTFNGPAPALGLATNGRIYVADGNVLLSYAADGTDRRTVVDLPNGAIGVTISPNGRLLAHNSSEPHQVQVVDLASGRSTPIPMPEGVQAGDQIAWAPTSDRIVFPAFRGDEEYVMVAPVDGAPARILGDGVIDPGMGVWWPAWSPQGDTVSFAGVDKETGTSAIHLIGADGTDLRTLATPSMGDAPAAVTWSPDPTVQRLLYTRAGDSLQSYLYDVDTGTDTLVADTFWPTWSPDGDHISVWGTKVAATADVLAGAAKWVPVTPTWQDGFCQDHPELEARTFCGPASWSPDGTRLISSDITGDHVLVVPVDGDSPAIVIDLATNAFETGNPAAWQPLR